MVQKKEKLPLLGSLPIRKILKDGSSYDAFHQQKKSEIIPFLHLFFKLISA